MSKSAKEEEGVKLLLEIHSSFCGNHTALRNLVGKAFRAGFYWPTAITDAEDLIRRCEGCQFLVKQLHVPAQRTADHPSFLAFRMLGFGHDRAF